MTQADEPRDEVHPGHAPATGDDPGAPCVVVPLGDALLMLAQAALDARPVEYAGEGDPDGPDPA